MIRLKSLKKVSKGEVTHGLFIEKKAHSSDAVPAEVIDVVGEVLETRENSSDTGHPASASIEPTTEEPTMAGFPAEEKAKPKKGLKNLFSRKKAEQPEDASVVVSQAEQSGQSEPSVESYEVSQPEEASAMPKRRFGARKPKVGPAVAAFSERPVELPVMVLMGYLPEVTSKDAMDYALGMAEKYLTQVGMAFFYVTKHDRGFIWEVHEGGPGKAYGPEISAKFGGNRLAGANGVPLKVVLDTATRKVEVSQGVEGLTAVLLPQGSTELADTSLIPRQNMTPAIPRRKGLLIMGALVLASGVLVSTLAGYFFRVQEFAAAPTRPIATVDAKLLPHLYWKNASLGLRPEDRVRAMRFEKGAWQPMDLYPRVTPAVATETPLVEPANGSVPSAPVPTGSAAAAQN